MGKRLDNVNKNKEIFEEYFKEDLNAIEEELNKSKDYSKIIDEEIKKLSGPSLGANKGGSHYLIEHLTNAVQLQTQRQGLRRDRFAIKKAILDYAAKFLDADSSSDNGVTEELLKELLAQAATAKKENQKPKTSENLDSAIDEILSEDENSSN